MKNKLISLFVVSTILLTGCKSAEDRVKEQLADNEAYQTYISLQEAGLLDEEGYYVGMEEVEAVEAMAPVQKQVSVTFAQNSLFGEIKFYTDSSMTIPAVNDCRLDKGECIYAQKPEVASEYSDIYEFLEYRIYEWKNNEKSELKVNNTGDTLIYQIPDNFSGNEIIIEAVGKCKEHSLSFNSYCTDVNGNQTSVSGEWSVNGESCLYEEYTLPATEKADIEFRYDNAEYYVYSTTPKAINIDTVIGTVEFEKLETGSKPVDYKVELKHYMQAIISGKTKEIKSVQVNNEVVNIENISNLKIDDKIEIETTVDYALYSTQLKNVEPEKLSDGNRYTFTVTETNTNKINFSVNKFNKDTAEKYVHADIANGNIEVKFDDILNPYILNDGDYVDKGTDVVVSIVANDGYYVSGKKVTDGVYTEKMKFSKFVKNVNDIISEHEVKKLIKVTLNTSDTYGTVTYKLNGNVISGGNYDLKHEDKLVIEYELADNSYEIYDETNNWVENIFASDKKKSVEIKITSEIDNKTINRDSYISVRKKGE